MQNQHYLELEDIFSRLGALRGAISVLHWDSACMMPEGGATERGEQLAALESLSHDLLTAPRVRDLLDGAEDNSANLNEWQSANLRLMRRAWLHASAVERKTKEAFTKAGSICEIVWRGARKANDFKTFLPRLEEVLKLTREIAQAKAEALKCSPYDALIDQYDAGRKSAEIDIIFSDLENFLPTFIQTVLEQQRSHPAPVIPHGPFPAERQRALGLQFMNALGFDFRHGRLDTSHHPFCGGTPTDIRITTRYDESDFTSALMGVLHETGHALYEAGLPRDWLKQPVGEALGMTIHESQSLLVEMQVCCGHEFSVYAAPLIAKAFGGDGTEWTPENFSRIYTKVEPGLIRVDADEVTYPAHIMLRYRLEKQLIAGTLALKDLPEAWNSGMHELLGVTVPSNRDGCMQDIHWCDGSFGYFPCYTLGAMAAAQFFQAARKQNPDIIPGVRKGDFSPLTSWLCENIHSHGSKFTADALLERATGKKLDPEIYKNHLRNRYLS